MINNTQNNHQQQGYSQILAGRMNKICYQYISNFPKSLTVQTIKP